METNTKHISDVEPISVMEDYKFQSCEFPRNISNNSEIIDYTRYNSSKNNRNKKVKFNKKVTIVNIPSHKKYSKMQNYQDYRSYSDEDIKPEKEKKCVNCNIF